MNRKEELEEYFNQFRKMVTTIHNMEQRYSYGEDSMSLEDSLILTLMFIDLGWKDKEDFLNGVGKKKVIHINVPEEEE